MSIDRFLREKPITGNGSSARESGALNGDRLSADTVSQPGKSVKERFSLKSDSTRWDCGFLRPGMTHAGADWNIGAFPGQTHPWPHQPAGKRISFATGV